MSEQNNMQDDKSNILQVISSVFWAIVGVQSDKNRERDFKSGKAKDFVVVGLIATVLFVLTIYGVVRLVLSFAGV
jgi:hypothetical protein